MNKFTELINSGVASFNYRPIAADVTVPCPICRTYNNVYSMINNTHLSIVDGKYVITGHDVANQELFELFLNSDTFANVDVRKYGSPSEFFARHNLQGHFDTLNNDIVYVLEPIEVRTEAPAEPANESLLDSLEDLEYGSFSYPRKPYKYEFMVFDPNSESIFGLHFNDPVEYAEALGDNATVDMMLTLKYGQSFRSRHNGCVYTNISY